MDGRHAKAGRTTILQAKHYAGSTFRALQRAMAEVPQALKSLRKSRYLLAASRPLTPQNKAELVKTLGPLLSDPAHIYSHGDLNALLRKFGDIERAHIKLWLSSSTVLDRILHAASRRFTEITREEIEAKVRVYAPNPSFKQARDKLRGRARHHHFRAARRRQDHAGRDDFLHLSRRGMGVRGDTKPR